MIYHKNLVRFKVIVSLTLALGWKNEKQPSGPIELHLEAGNIVFDFYLNIFRILMCCVVSTNCYQRSNPGSMFINRTREVVDSSSRAVRSVTTDSEKFLLNQECSFNKIEKLGYCDCS